MRITLGTVGLVVAGAAFCLAAPGALRAGEDTPHDAVEKLVPDLLSDDDAERQDAERRLFALGEPGRLEIERMTRDTDARKAITALRLLASPKWSKAKAASGEQRVERDGDAIDDLGDALDGRIQDLTERLERQMAEMRRRFEGLGRDFAFKIPKIELRDLNGVHGASSGSIVENDRCTSWTVGDDGRVKVKVKDGDGPETTYEAKDMAELRAQHPDVAARVEPMVGGRRVFRLGVDKTPGRARVFTFRDGGLSEDGTTLDLAGATPVLGVEWTPVPEVLRAQLEMGSGGMVVERVVPDTLAERLGLARNDVLLEVAGRSVGGPGEVKAALADVAQGATVKAVILRRGQRKELETTK